ncbi:dihydroorotate dehydrogenase electron transfer subunit [Candidatus Woesearchaeota archaeon]|nr:dihydroorotate dehydrogenase electron transfer subunit [Candidatus Woesearchaeota archaeon]
MNETEKTEMPLVIKVSKIITENDRVKTLFFKHKLDYKPGQFLMVWLPGVDEKPYSASYVDKDFFAITVEKKGGFSESLHKLKVGDKIGIRGPYGNPFKIKKGKACVVGGGCGIAPIMHLVKILENPTVIVGCKSKNQLLFGKKIKDFIVCTDDGSYGTKGFVTEEFEKLLKNEKFDVVYTCGPEIMMKKVFDICQREKIECQASLERFMICGIGICSQCMCSNKRVCKEGPVFDSKTLAGLKDFGKNAMIKTGKKVTLKEYYSYKTKY